MDQEFSPQKVLKFCPRCGGVHFEPYGEKANKCRDCGFVFFFNAAAAVAVILRNEGKKVRIVSVPSEGLFRSQSAEYQEQVLPRTVKTFGLTAGLPVNLLGLVGANGRVFGLESYGFSAPYTVLDEKLGFTPTQVAEQIRQFLA